MRIQDVFHGLLHRIAAFARTILHTLWSLVRRLGAHIYHTILTAEQWTVKAVLKRVLIVGLTLWALSFVLVAFALYYPSSQIPAHAPVNRTVYLNQGWGDSMTSEYRQTYYYTPQGTNLYNLRYSWFAALELPFSRQKFAGPNHMRALGFIVDDATTPQNPNHMPVGFTKHYDRALREDVLDITCAACHTGELHVATTTGERVAIRIDGGQAMHAFTAMSIGHFGPELVTSMLNTVINPFAFERFARNVLGQGYTSAGKSALRWELISVLRSFVRQAITDKSNHLYPVEEGFGRTDAVGRISNKVFAEEMDEANYRVADAPVSYPAVWDIWKFDWVQYTGSVAQPMARNMGESLGVGATLHTMDLYGRPVPPSERLTGATLIDNLKTIEEKGIRTLTPPKWPEDILGPIDRKKAEAGRALYLQHCAGCHQPCLKSEYDRAVYVPLRPRNEEFWQLKLLPVQDIGTDPQAALNFNNIRIDLSKTGVSDGDARALVGQLLDTQQQRREAYAKRANLPAPPDGKAAKAAALDSLNLRSLTIGGGLNVLGLLLRNRTYADMRLTPEQAMQYDGDGALDLPQVLLVYKARPLAGVWATAPYLHNGSVPNLYELLSPADKRSKKFFVGRFEFDPVLVGILPQPLGKGGFWLDTSIRGNWNIGHEFRAGYKKWEPCEPPSNGVIGPELSDSDRWALIEYLKIHEDTNLPACSTKPPAYACTAKAPNGGRP